MIIARPVEKNGNLSNYSVRLILTCIPVSSMYRKCSAQTKNRWGHLSHYPGKKGDI